MTENSPTPSRSFALPVGVGLLQGLMLWWLAGSLEDGTWPATKSGLYAMLLLAAVFLPPTIYLVSPWRERPRAWVMIAIVLALLVGAGAHHGLHVEAVDLSTRYRSYFPFALFLAAFVWLFHAIPFAQVLLAGRDRVTLYPQLFYYAWRNALQLALAALFTAIFWVLLWLWIQLFDMLKIHFPKILFSDDARFSLLVAAIVFAAGFHLAGSADRLLVVVRQQVLALLKWLALVATAILILFAGALLIRTPELLASHRHVISATWLLWLALVTVYLYNAGYQDGDSPQPYPAPAARLLRYATPLIVLVAVMALYALLVRSAAYGLTISRVWGTLVAVTTVAYSIAYVVAAIPATPWMRSMGNANVGIAVFLLLSLGLLLSPVLAPERLSAVSVANHLIQNPNRITGQDLMLLRFDLGAYGKTQLEKLNANRDPLVRRGAAAALAVASPAARYRFAYPKIDAATLAFRSFPAGTEVDADLRSTIASSIVEPYGYRVRARLVDQSAEDTGTDSAPAQQRASLCSQSAPCPVLFINLSDKADPEAVVFLEDTTHIYQRIAGRWTSVQFLTAKCPPCRDRTLIRDLESGRYQASRPPWKDLKVGDSLFVITER
jgi:hypothetical protein